MPLRLSLFHSRSNVASFHVRAQPRVSRVREFTLQIRCTSCRQRVQERANRNTFCEHSTFCLHNFQQPATRCYPFQPNLSALSKYPLSKLHILPPFVRQPPAPYIHCRDLQLSYVVNILSTFNPTGFFERRDSHGAVKVGYVIA